MQTKTWTVELLLSEEDGTTRARAVLHAAEGPGLVGHGVARRNPHDTEVAEIGDEVAAARALSGLAQALLGAAEVDITAVTNEQAFLPH
ncbi:MAG: DUF1876 domain-containing protein [Mycobacteriales bacterium]